MRESREREFNARLNDEVKERHRIFEERERIRKHYAKLPFGQKSPVDMSDDGIRAILAEKSARKRASAKEAAETRKQKKMLGSPKAVVPKSVAKKKPPTKAERFVKRN